MESLEEKIVSFLSVEEPSAHWIRPHTDFTHRGNCSGTAGGDGMDDGIGWGGASVSPGDGTSKGEGGYLCEDIESADSDYCGGGYVDGWGNGYTEDLYLGRAYHPHLPFGGIRRFNGKTVHYTPPMPVEICAGGLKFDEYLGREISQFFTCSVFSDKVSSRNTYETDRVPVIIEEVEGNVARGCVIMDDLTSFPCYIAREGDSFALGEDPQSALDLATRRHQAAVTPEPECGYDDEELPF